MSAGLYDIAVNKIDGTATTMKSYKDKVLLIVNVASECGYTPQYTGLEELYKKYKDKGLVVLGFPANEFGAQEPGTDAEIKAFCATRYSVSFDLFSKIVVKGPGIHPLYKFLTTESGFNGEIGWNFAKFLIAPDGRVAGRFGPEEDPLSRAFTSAVETLLAPPAA